MKSLIQFTMFCFFTFINLANINAQDILNPKFANEIKTKYAVPDAPALTLLNGSSNNILKPGSVKDLAVGFSEFINDKNQISLPKSFAVEVSPGLLINGKNLSIQQYRENTLLYRLRLSIATSRTQNNSNATDLAFGLRITLSDNSDLRLQDNYVKDATALAEELNDIIDKAREKLGPGADIKTIEASSEFVETRKKLLEKLNEKWSQDTWNKNISEVAFAVKTSSKDSLAKNLLLTKLAAWYSSAYAIEDWGQLVIGANACYEKDLLTNKFKSAGSLAARFYAGTNNYKVFMQFEGTMVEENKSNWLLDSGLEFRVEDKLWAEFSAGIQEDKQLGESVLKTAFKLKYEL